MFLEQDLHTLQQAGIKDIDSLIAAAASFLRAHPRYTSKPVLNALSEQEEDFLIQGGADGVAHDIHEIREQRADYGSENMTKIASEYALMVSTAYAQRDVAELLGVSTSRIRQRIDSHTLYVINDAGGRVCPGFQFTDSGTLPGLEAVLSAISKTAHPLAVQRFFMTISPDLESELLGSILSPRDWLLTGHPPEPVILLAREL